MKILYGITIGILFALWLRFAAATWERLKLLDRLAKWVAFPGWRDSLIRSEHSA